MGTERVTYSTLISELRLDEEKAIIDKTLFTSQGFTLGDRGPVFSPNGKYVAFWGWNTDFSAGLWFFDLETKRSFPIPTQGLDMYPQWSPNSDTLLFESKLNGKSQLLIIKLSALLPKNREGLAAD